MTAIYSSISLLLLVYLIFFAYQTYRIDKLRQDLFLMRDRLFDSALDGAHDFNDPAYIASRQLINGMIRYGHRLSVPMMLAFLFFLPKSKTKFAKDSLDAFIASATQEQRLLFARTQQELNERVAKHVLTSPLFIFTMLIPALMIVLTKLGFNLAQELVKLNAPSFKYLDTLVYAEAGYSKS